MDAPSMVSYEGGTTLPLVITHAAAIVDETDWVIWEREALHVGGLAGCSGTRWLLPPAFDPAEHRSDAGNDTYAEDAAGQLNVSQM